MVKLLSIVRNVGEPVRGGGGIYPGSMYALGFHVKDYRSSGGVGGSRPQDQVATQSVQAQHGGA